MASTETADKKLLIADCFRRLSVLALAISTPLPCLADISFTVSGAALLCFHPAVGNQHHASRYLLLSSEIGIGRYLLEPGHVWHKKIRPIHLDLGRYPACKPVLHTLLTTSLDVSQKFCDFGGSTQIDDEFFIGIFLIHREITHRVYKKVNHDV